MATKNEEIVKEETEQKAPTMESIFIPRAGAGEDPVFYVSVSAPNGGTRSFTLKRGSSNLVPTYVAEEIRRAERAQRRMYRNKNSMIDAARNLR